MKKYISILFISLILTGCATDTYYSSGDTITTEVQIGMTVEEVKAVMGEPRLPGYTWNKYLKEQLWSWDYIIKKPDLFHTEWHLTIYFKNNKVIDIQEWAPGF